MALTSEQILNELGQVLVDEQLGTQDLPGMTVDNVVALAPALGQLLKPRLDSLIRSSMLVDEGIVRAFTRFNYIDDVVQNVIQKVSAPLWSAGTTASLNAGSMFTSSTQTGSTSGKYYADVYQKNPTAEGSSVQFSVTYGHSQGSGSGVASTDNDPYKAIYTQYANTLLNAGDKTWTFDSSGDSKHFYAIAIKRSLFKDRVDPGNWELVLSGSGGSLTHKTLHLIDDSGQATAATLTGSNTIYNIVSGTIDGGQDSGTNKYGFFYPENGILILDATFVSSSIGIGTGSAIGEGGADLHGNLGSTLEAQTRTDSKAHYEFLKSIQLGGKFQARSEEDVTSTHFFCRIRNSEYNFSNNSTYADTDGNFTNKSYENDPKAYITTVGLYNDAKELLAVAKLSKPLLKSFSREAVVKVKLDF